MKAFVAVTVLLAPLFAAPAFADQSGWEKFGSVLGGGGADRESAYLYGLQLGAEREAILAEARNRRATEELRAQVQRLWMAFGCSASDAAALAAAYEPATSDAAVITGVRRNGARSALPGLRDALNNYNYQLANQLLIAFALVGAEEQGGTSKTETASEADGRREATARAFEERNAAIVREETEPKQAQRQADLDASKLSPQERRELSVGK